MFESKYMALLNPAYEVWRPKDIVCIFYYLILILQYSFPVDPMVAWVYFNVDYNISYSSSMALGLVAACSNNLKRP